MAGFQIRSRDLVSPSSRAEIHATDIDILTAGFNGVGVVPTGNQCAVTAQGSPDMTVAIAAGTIRIAAGTLIAVTAGNGTITTADATNPRIDLISASNAGVKTVTAGTAAAAPKPPDLPAGHVALAFVYVAATDTAIGSTEITDKRVILPTPSTVDATLGADVSMVTANTDYDGPSGSFGIGTWLIVYKCLFQANGSPRTFRAKLWDGSTIYDEGEDFIVTTGFRGTLGGIAIVTLAAAATLKVTVQGDTNAQTLKRDGGAGSSHTTTRLSGVRLF